jgi:gas vesicle protein
VNREQASGFGIGLLAGLILGAAVGILYAPKSGTETRKLIRDKSGQFVKRAKALPADVRAKFNKSTLADVKGRSAY